MKRGDRRADGNTGSAPLKKSRAPVVACRSELKGAGDCGEIRLELCGNLGDDD